MGAAADGAAGARSARLSGSPPSSEESLHRFELLRAKRDASGEARSTRIDCGSSAQILTTLLSVLMREAGF
jgi:hypothetical protein